MNRPVTDTSQLKRDILNQSLDFDAAVMRLFFHQAEHCEVFNRFLSAMDIDPENVRTPEEIPFLPIQFFKNHSIKTGQWKTELTFHSSGTTSKLRSKHHVSDLAFYERHSTNLFSYHYGSPKQYCFLVLLPGYDEAPESSLIRMLAAFIKESRFDTSGFYMGQNEALLDQLIWNERTGVSTILWGVSHALLVLSEKLKMELRHTRIFETGGMKGKREEMTKQALHDELKTAFGLDTIHSEYGMTELMSQAYSDGNGIYQSPATVQVIGREINDPFGVEKMGKTARLDIIDLANFDTCAFIATQDIVRIHTSNTFEIMGRLHDADLRGCNLLYAM